MVQLVILLAIFNLSPIVLPEKTKVPTLRESVVKKDTKEQDKKSNCFVLPHKQKGNSQHSAKNMPNAKVLHFSSYKDNRFIRN